MPAGDRPLNFISSSPRNGATGVSLNPQIRLTFDRNVQAELAHNRNQIRLFHGSTRVGIRVTGSGAFAQRRNLYVRPTSRLRANTEYRLVLLPRLRANNGNTLGETVTIRFRTRRDVTPDE